MYYYRSLIIMHYYKSVHVCLIQRLRMNNIVVFMPRCLLQLSCMFQGHEPIVMFSFHSFACDLFVEYAYLNVIEGEEECMSDKVN